MRILSLHLSNFRLWGIPIILLIWGLFSVFNLSTIPIAEGFGWDGVTYAELTMNFEKLISNKSISQYYIGRLIPSIIMHYLFRLFGISLTPQTVLIAYQVYNVIVLFISGIIFNLIAKELKWNFKKILIGFIALFINYPILNLHFYYPVLTDPSAFILSLLLLYAYLRNKSIVILFISFIGFFTWPTEFIIGAILYIFSISSVKDYTSYYDKVSNKIQTIILFIFIISPFLIYYILFNAKLFIGPLKGLLLLLNMDHIIHLNYANIQSFSYNHLMTASVFNIVYLWLMLKIFIDKLNKKKLIKGLYSRSIIAGMITFLILFLTLYVFKNQISYNEEKLSIVSMFRILSISSTKLTGQFIISHISYFGPFLLFMFFYLKGYLSYISRNSIALSIIFIILIVFSVNSESRHLINLYPFFVLFFIDWFNFNQIKRFNLFAVVLLIVSILYSKIWFPINLPASTFPNPIWDDLDKFPMQYYFMNHGPWQNTEMYLLHLVVSLVVLIILFFFLPEEKQKKLQTFLSLNRVKKTIRS